MFNKKIIHYVIKKKKKKEKGKKILLLCKKKNTLKSIFKVRSFSKIQKRKVSKESL